MLKISTNIDKFINNSIANYKKQVNYATFIATKNTAYTVKNILTAEVVKVFNRPTPQIKNSIRVYKLSKEYADVQYQNRYTNHTFKVYVLDEGDKGIAPVKTLWTEVEGGQRKNKGIELLLQSAGILPIGYHIVPGKDLRLDQYGNIPLSLFISIKSELGLMTDEKSNKPRYIVRKGLTIVNPKLKGYFFINNPQHNLPMGIYSRKNNILSLIIYFVKNQYYNKRFDFYNIGMDSARIIYPNQFKETLDNALSSK